MIKQLKAKINSDKNFKDILKGSSLTFIVKILSTMLGLVTSLIIARYYGAEVVGVVAIINSVLAIFGVFALMGMNTAILRLIPEYLQKYSVSSAYGVYKKALSIVFGLSFLGAITLYFSSPLISEYIFHKAYLEYFFTLAALFIGIRVIATLNQATLRGLQNIKLYAIMQFLPSLLNFLFIIVVTFFFYYKYNPVYMMFATNFAMLIVTFMVVQHLFKTMTNVNEKKYVPSSSEIMMLSFPMFLTASMHMVIGQSDTIMLGMMRSEAEVGVYDIVFKLAILTSFVLTAVNSIAAPKFSQLYNSGQMEELKEIAQKSTKLIFWGSLPIVFSCIFLGKFILNMFGGEFIVGYHALIFLAIGQFINASFGSIGLFLNMTGNQKEFLKIIVFSGILNILLNFILIPKYGITGAAITTMISISIWNILGSIYIKTKFGFSISYIPIIHELKGK